MNKKDSGNQVQFLPICMSIGVSLGVAIGAALDNIGVWMCIGVSVGVGLGATIDASKRAKENASEKDEQNQE